MISNKDLGKILAISCIGLLSCKSKENSQLKADSEPAVYTGIVKSERYVNGIMSDDFYFTIDTNDKLETFRVVGGNAPSIADSSIDKGDTVKIMIPTYIGHDGETYLQYNKNRIGFGNIVEINGKRIH